MLIRLTKSPSLAVPLCFLACGIENDLDYERILSGLAFAHFAENTETSLWWPANALTLWLSKPGNVSAWVRPTSAGQREQCMHARGLAVLRVLLRGFRSAGVSSAFTHSPRKVSLFPP